MEVNTGVSVEVPVVEPPSHGEQALQDAFMSECAFALVAQGTEVLWCGETHSHDTPLWEPWCCVRSPSGGAESA